MGVDKIDGRMLHVDPEKSQQNTRRMPDQRSANGDATPEYKQREIQRRRTHNTRAYHPLHTPRKYRDWRIAECPCVVEHAKPLDKHRSGHTSYKQECCNQKWEVEPEEEMATMENEDQWGELKKARHQ